MDVVPAASADLPVIWWAFWLVVVAVGIFAAFAWWLTRAALREDTAPREGMAPHEDSGPHEDATRDGVAAPDEDASPHEDRDEA